MKDVIVFSGQDGGGRCENVSGAIHLRSYQGNGRDDVADTYR